MDQEENLLYQNKKCFARRNVFDEFSTHAWYILCIILQTDAIAQAIVEGIENGST